MSSEINECVQLFHLSIKRTETFSPSFFQDALAFIVSIKLNRIVPFN